MLIKQYSMNSNVKKILIADDHAAIRAGLKKILSNHLPNLKFGEAENGEEAIRMVSRSGGDPWDVVILDLALKGIGGLEVLKHLKDIDNKIGILIFSVYPEDQMAIRCLKMGAQGYLNKAAPDHEIIQAVNKLLQGKKHYSEQLTSTIIAELSRPDDRLPHERLSDREFEILLLIGEGQGVSAISEKLKLSISSINTYRSRILKKMHLLNNAGIINYVVKNGLRTYL